MLDRERYSRKRLLVIGFVWFAVGVAMFATSPDFGADARADGGGCQVDGPCMFPAEHYRGGIVLGAGYLDGKNLAIEMDEDPAPVPFPTPSDVPDKEATIGAGVNSLDVNDGFFVYKSWKYYDTRTENIENAYIWIDASPAKLSGSSTCSTDKKYHCDLYAKVSEFSASKFEAHVDTAWWVPFDLDKSKKSYWLANPEKDNNCGVVGSTFTNELCIGLLDDGFAQSAIENVDAQLTNIKFRLHDARAIKPSGGKNKKTEFQDLYAEVRYGDGSDRVNTASTDTIKELDPYPQTNLNRSAGLANNFQCKGNPDLDPNCEIDSYKKNDPPGTQKRYNRSYIDIYR